MTGSNPREVGRIIALRLLEAKPRTEAELHTALCDRGIPQDVATDLVARYVEVGLLDDRAFARAWVDSRMRSRGLGPVALRQELRRHRVPDPLIDEALGAIEQDDSLQAAVECVWPKVARCVLPLSPKDERRLLSHLMRRGHSFDTARAALAQAVARMSTSA